MASILDQISKLAAQGLTNATKAATTPTTTQTATPVKTTTPSSSSSTTSSSGSLMETVGKIAGNALGTTLNAAKNTSSGTVQQPTQQVPSANADLANQVQELVNILKQQNQPKEVPQYQSPYQGQIAELINRYNTMPAFQFDATNNPTIQAYQKQAADAAYQDAARRNMKYSTIATEGAAEAIANVLSTMGPQLEQQAYNQYRDQESRILQQLNTLMNMDQNDYQRFMQNYQLGNQANQDYLSNTANILNILNNLDNQAYNRQQNQAQFDYTKQQDAINNAFNQAQMTGYYNPYAGVQISPEVYQYANDYQAEINRRRQTPDTSDDYLIPQLEAARAQKIFNSPDLLAQYGEQYKTPAQKARDLEAQIAQEQARLAADPNSYENQKKMLELTKLAEEVRNIQNYGAREAELKLQEIESRIRENAASAAASYALADQRKNSNENDPSKTNMKYSDYYNDAMQMKQAGMYDVNNNYVRRYSDRDIFDWVLGLSISSDWKANLLKDMGIPLTLMDEDIKQERYNRLF